MMIHKTDEDMRRTVQGAEKEKLECQVREHMEATKANPNKVRNFFQKSRSRHTAD